MRLFFLSLFLIVQILGSKTCNAQGVGTFQWTNGAPNNNPGLSGAKFAVDKNTYRWYEWVSGTSWVESGDRIQRISGCSAPNYTPTIHQSHVVINNCTNPEIYIWNGTSWAMPPSGGGGGSVSLPSQQIGFGTGSGITSDTSFRYNSTDRTISTTREANTTNPFMFARYKDMSSQTFRMFEMQAINQTNYAFNNIKFGLYGTNFPASNGGVLPGNHVWRMGYNIGRPIASLSGIEMAFESYFRAPMLNGETTWNYEWHVEQQDTQGIVHRPITIQAAHNGRLGDIGFATDGLYCGNYSNPNNRWLESNRWTGNWDFADTMKIRYRAPMANLPLMQVKSANDSRYWDVLQYDASDRLVISPQQNDTYINSRNLVFQTASSIYTDDGNDINIGKVGKGSALNITSPSTSVMRFRSQTSGFFDVTVNNFSGSDNLLLSTPSGNAGLVMFGNVTNDLLSLKNDRVGINNPFPTATLDVVGSAKITGANGHSQLNLATPYTPTSSADTNGSVGSLAWDTDYIYIKTSAGWKRSALSTF